MRADDPASALPREEADLGSEYRELVEAYDRGGLPFERGLARLSQALAARGGGYPCAQGGGEGRSISPGGTACASSKRTPAPCWGKQIRRGLSVPEPSAVRRRRTRA